MCLVNTPTRIFLALKKIKARVGYSGYAGNFKYPERYTQHLLVQKRSECENPRYDFLETRRRLNATPIRLASSPNGQK
jgi:hypothetical protein